MAAGSNGKVVESKANGINGNGHIVIPTVPAGKNEKKTKKNSGGVFSFATITRYDHT